KLELANYADLMSFAQFSTDVDASTKAILDHGERITELLKQGVNEPLSHDLMILSLFLNRYGYLDKLEVEEVLPFESFMHRSIKEDYPEILEEINIEYKLSETL